MEMTAGALLAQMMIEKAKGNDVSEIRKQFEEQSKRQLGGCCTEFSCGSENEEENGD